MSEKIQSAVARLNSILPLHAQQKNLSREGASLYQQLLTSFVEKGRMLMPQEIATLTSDVSAVVAELKKTSLIVWDGNNNPVGIYPFTMEQRVHSIMVNGFAIHAMCALDALAVSAVSGLPVVIDSRCDVTKTPLHIDQKGCQLLNVQELQEVFFAINWNAASSSCCCADSLCTEMIFIRGVAAANKWQAQDNSNRELFTLEEAVKFATGFFKPLWPNHLTLQSHVNSA